MREILTEIDDIAERIGSFEDRREDVSQEIRKKLKDEKLGIGESFVKEVEKTDLGNNKIAGIDGGLVKKSYQGLDLTLVRAVAAIFSYKNNGLDDVSYLPGVSPTPELKIFEELESKNDFSKVSSLERLSKEIEIISETLRSDCDLILADGSILPHPSDIPKEDSPIYSRFEELLSQYRKMYRLARETHFAGVCEDSRARKLIRLIEDEIDLTENQKLIGKSRDITILNYILEKGERSFIFKYSKNPNQNPILRNLNEHASNIYSFYMKNTHYDVPVRVDFYSENSPIKTANRISSMIYNISSDNEEYGLPTVLIEADKRAKISKEELEMIHKSIRDRCGDLPNLRDLSRRNRPF